MEPQINNRVARDLDNWKATEARFEKLFSSDILKDPAFLKQKLNFYDHLQSKYSRSKSSEENMTLVVLSRRSDDLKRTLYPNLWQRILKQLFTAFNTRRAATEINVTEQRNITAKRDKSCNE